MSANIEKIIDDVSALLQVQWGYDICKSKTSMNKLRTSLRSVLSSCPEITGFSPMEGLDGAEDQMWETTRDMAGEGETSCEEQLDIRQSMQVSSPLFRDVLSEQIKSIKAAIERTKKIGKIFGA